MKANVGGLDKAIRLLLSALLIIFYFNNTSGRWVDITLIAVAAVLFLTALVGTCPIYLMLGINSRKKSQDEGNAKII